MMVGEMNEFYRKEQKAYNWWNNLTPGQKREYEHKAFGDGEFWEDNTLSNEDILFMYCHIDNILKQ